MDTSSWALALCVILATLPACTSDNGTSSASNRDAAAEGSSSDGATSDGGAHDGSDGKPGTGSVTLINASYENSVLGTEIHLVLANDTGAAVQRVSTVAIAFDDTTVATWTTLPSCSQWQVPAGGRSRVLRFVLRANNDPQFPCGEGNYSPPGDVPSGSGGALGMGTVTVTASGYLDDATTFKATVDGEKVGF